MFVVEFIFEWICKYKKVKLFFICLDVLVDEVLLEVVINEDEVNLLCKIEVGCLCIINVDDFDYEEFIVKVNL